MTKKKIKSSGKRRNPKRKTGVTFHPSVVYWYPIQQAIAGQSGGMSQVAAVSTDEVGDSLYSSIINPLHEARSKMLAGKATFQDFWNLMQGAYFMLFALEYVLTTEKYRFNTDGSVSEGQSRDYWEKRHSELLDKTAGQYTVALKSVAERRDKSGRYGLTGDDNLMLQEMIDELGNLLDWGSLRMVYHAASRVYTELSGCEHRISQSWGG